MVVFCSDNESFIYRFCWRTLDITLVVYGVEGPRRGASASSIEEEGVMGGGVGAKSIM